MCLCVHCSPVVAQTVKNPPAKQETWVWSLGQEDALKKGMASHSSVLAWRIPWTEEPGGLPSMGSQRVRHDWATNTFTLLLLYMHPYVHSNTIYNSQDTEIIQMPINRWTEKDVVHIHNGTLLSILKKKAICSNMDGTRDDHTKWSQVRKRNITYMWNLKYATKKNTNAVH